jgi:hypothetical protein
MKWTLLTAAAIVSLTTAAQAAGKPYTFYKGGYWETFGMASNSDGDPNFSTTRNLTIIERLAPIPTGPDRPRAALGRRCS